MPEVTIGERLQALVRERGLEQREVAEFLGMKPSTFNGYVGNRREPSVAVLKKLAEYFGVSVDYIIGLSNVRDPYLKHLRDDLKSFVSESENNMYIELARDIKDKTNSPVIEFKKAK